MLKSAGPSNAPMQLNNDEHFSGQWIVKRSLLHAGLASIKTLLIYVNFTIRLIPILVSVEATCELG